MTPTKSHTELHRRSAEIAEQTAAFIAAGGQINEVAIRVAPEIKRKRYSAPKKRAGGRPVKGVA
ncbi:MAG: hypothetical protein CL583_01840 [Alteromonadaceae bacterium]|nr:hypothetical protein [Alteromonadaceae bacterium]|tara:strand:- start:52 stop:243 length:192 start_codon:yes stop_codon:yes gene_type:complete